MADRSNVVKTPERFNTELSVELIAETSMLTFDLDVPLSDVLHELNKHDYSQAPITHGDEFVGVFCTQDPHTAGPVKNSMRMLNGALEIPADIGIREAFRILAGDQLGFRLVARGESIDGIITRSDLQKLPVRILAFTYVSTLEDLFTQIIDNRSNDSEIVDLLGAIDPGLDGFSKGWITKGAGPQAVHTLLKNQMMYAKKSVIPALVDLIDFSQKCYLVYQTLGLDPSFGYDMAHIQKYLLNPIALNKNYVASTWQVGSLNSEFALCDKWMVALQQSSN